MKRFVLITLVFSIVGLALVPSSFATPPRQRYDNPDPSYNSGDDDSPNKHVTAQPVNEPSLGSDSSREVDQDPSLLKRLRHRYLSLRERMALVVANVRGNLTR
jgi:hypothetical protein